MPHMFLSIFVASCSHIITDDGMVECQLRSEEVKLPARTPSLKHSYPNHTFTLIDLYMAYGLSTDILVVMNNFHNLHKSGHIFQLQRLL